MDVEVFSMSRSIDSDMKYKKEYWVMPSPPINGETFYLEKETDSRIIYRVIPEVFELAEMPYGYRFFSGSMAYDIFLIKDKDEMPESGVSPVL